MDWTQHNILLLWACGPVIALVQLGILWPRRRQPGAVPLIVLMVASGLWVTGELLELGSGTLAQKMIWARVRFLGIATIPPAWFAFSCYFGGRRYWLTKRSMLILSAISAAFVLLTWTNEYHGLIWRKIWLDKSWVIPTTASRHGPAYFVLVLYTYVLVVAGSVQLFRASRTFLREYRYQVILLISAIALPFAANIFFQLRLGPVPYLDVTPLAMIISGVIFSWNFLRGGLLPRPMPLARNVVIQSMSDGVIVTNLGLLILDVNPAARAMLDLPSKLTGEQDLGTFVSIPSTVRHGGRSSVDSWEVVRIQTDGRTRYYDARRSPIHHRWAGQVGYVFIIRETTERREFEADQTRSHSAMEQTSEGIAITDPKGIIEYVNPAFERIMGYARSELIGVALQLVRQEASLSDDCLELHDAIERDGVWKGKTVQQRKDGTSFHEETTVSPILDAHGERMGWLYVVRDITRQTQMEDMLRQSQKIEAIGHLADGVAHDFNNLLAPILGYSELIQKDLSVDHPHSTQILEIQKAAKRARTLTRQLLAFSRKQVLDIKTVDVNDSITDLEELLRRMLRENIEFQCELSDDVQPVRADVSQLEQVLINLAVNAQDAMPAGGRLTIRTSNYEQSTLDANTRRPPTPGRYVLIEVTDTGYGMTPQMLEHIFEPFFTTKAEGYGTGLGLATVLGIVRQHEGHISADSYSGKGTKFSIYLPAFDGKTNGTGLANPPQTGAGSTASDHQQDEFILLVEDNDLARRTVSTMLSRLGYRTLSFSGGEECLEYLRATPVKATLLVTDVIMPGQNGKELHEAVKGLLPELKVLYISGYTQSTIEQADVSSESGAYLHNPFTKNDLRIKIESLLGV